MKTWRRRTLDSVSQLINAVFFKGCAKETLSARCWRENRRTAIKWIDRLFFWDKAHCYNAYQGDIDDCYNYSLHDVST